MPNKEQFFLFSLIRNKSAEADTSFTINVKFSYSARRLNFHRRHDNRVFS